VRYDDIVPPPRLREEQQHPMDAWVARERDRLRAKGREEPIVLPFTWVGKPPGRAEE
jgi:hypothetical protein